MISQDEVLEQIRIAEEKVELGHAVERLQHNADFKKVFTNYLFKDKILEVVNGMHEYGAETPEHKQCIAELETLSRLQDYLKILIDKGQWAQEEVISAKSIPDSELD